jgi:hypothetical protein
VVNLHTSHPARDGAKEVELQLAAKPRPSTGSAEHFMTSMSLARIAKQQCRESGVLRFVGRQATLAPQAVDNIDRGKTDPAVPKPGWNQSTRRSSEPSLRWSREV